MSMSLFDFMPSAGDPGPGWMSHLQYLDQGPAQAAVPLALPTHDDVQGR